VRDPGRVVVGVDGSACSRVALKFALADAARRDAEIQVVSVVHDPKYWPVGIGMAYSSAGTPATEQILSEVEQETQSIVAEVGESAARVPVPIPTHYPAIKFVGEANSSRGRPSGEVPGVLVLAPDGPLPNRT
jgi:nucleotide-binding universal stress UspA family protein